MNNHYTEFINILKRKGSKVVIIELLIRLGNAQSRNRFINIINLLRLAFAYLKRCDIVNSSFSTSQFASICMKQVGWSWSKSMRLAWRVM